MTASEIDSESDLFKRTRSARPSAVPLVLLWVLCAIGGVVGLLRHDHLVSLVIWAVLLLASFALLLVYRLGLVSATREVDANASVIGIKPIERITIVVVVIACCLNGIVIGLWVGSLSLWWRFQ